MSYRKTFHVDEPKGALEEVTKKLTDLGFKSQDASEYHCRLAGPRHVSTRKSPLTLISRIEIRVTDQALRVVAEMNRGLKLFLVILAIVFVPMFIAAPLVPNNAMWLALAANLAIWALLLPLIHLAFRAKAKAAIEDLMKEL